MRKIQNYCRVIKSDAAQMSVVAAAMLDFVRIVLNFYILFFRFYIQNYGFRH